MPILYNYLIFAAVAATLLALLAWIKRSLTTPALIIAWSCAFFITTCSGLGGFLILATVFVLTIVSDKIGRKKDERKKSEQRKAIQIIANVGTGTLVLLLGTVFNLTAESFFIYAAVMATSLADSMASGIGVLNRKDPVSILTFKAIPKGYSGGVSILGTIASLFGSFVIAFLYSLFSHDLVLSLYVLLSGFLGCIFDSFLGAAVQGKYICSVDKKYTEKSICHGKPAMLTSGYRWIDNNIVNLGNNLFAALFSLICILLMRLF